MALNFYIAVLLIAVIGNVLSLIFRKKLAKNIMGRTDKIFLWYLLTALILIIIEEGINCSPSQGCLPWITIPILFIYVLIFGFVIKMIPVRSVFLATLLFSIIGLVLEFFVYGNKEIL